MDKAKNTAATTGGIIACTTNRDANRLEVVFIIPPLKGQDPFFHAQFEERPRSVMPIPITTMPANTENIPMKNIGGLPSKAINPSGPGIVIAI